MPDIVSYCSIDKKGVSLNGMPFYNNDSNKDTLAFFDSILHYFEIKYPKYSKMDLLAKLGFLTSEILLSKLPDIKERFSPYDLGILMANKSSSLHTDLHYWETTKQIPSPSAFVYTLPNVVNAEICIRNGFKGENTFLIADDFLSSGIIEYAKILFDKQLVKFCLCGWIELLGDNFNSIIFAVEENETSLGKFSKETVSNILNL